MIVLIRCALCLLVVVTTVAVTTTNNRVLSSDKLPASDIRLTSQPFLIASSRWVITVHNDPVHGYAASELRDVKIQLAVEPASLLEASGWEAFPHRLNDGSIDATTGVWSIPRIPVGGSATTVFYPFRLLASTDDITPVRFSASLISSAPAEPSGHEANNVTEEWYVADGPSVRYTLGDAGVDVSVVSRSDTQAVFEIEATNYVKGNFGGVGSSRSYNSRQYDVRVKFELSPGLRFASGPSPPDVVSIDERTRMWNVGIVSPDHREFPTWTVPVIVTAPPSLDALPLEERCLTATVEHALPAFDLDLSRRVNDVSTACVEHPKQVVTHGEVTLFDFFPCVGATSVPCTDVDTLELVATLPSPTRQVQPEDIIIRISPDDRTVRPGPVELWSTATRFELTDSQIRLPRTEWGGDSPPPQDRAREDLTVSGPDGGAPPGSFTMNFTDNIPDIVITDTTRVVGDVFRVGGEVTFDLDFGSLGTYVLTFDIRATHNIAGLLTDTGTYTFHVGPIAELDVRDTGTRSPLAASYERAYTIVADNNGPDEARAVEVKLRNVPEDAQAFVSGSTKRVDDEDVSGSDGRYAQGDCVDGFCEATWTIGKMSVSSGRTSIGKMPFPTLTLIAPDGASTSGIEASIESTEPYSVTIDGTVHSTAYFDYIDENNTDTIEALPGTGEGAPGQPQDLQAQIYTVPLTAALVWWTEVESVNGFPVSGYEVFIEQPENGACQAPSTDQKGERLTGTTYVDRRAKEGELTCYYVRAVNELEVPGYWSGPVLATGDSPGQPRLSVQGGDPVDEGDAAQFTVSASPAPAAGERLTFYYTVTQRGRYVAAGDLGRKETTIGNSSRATITVPTVGNDTDDADGEIFVTLNNGEGYTASSDRSASVEVRDDDNPEVSFADDPATATVSEGDGTHNVVVNLVPAPHAATSINYQIGGVAEAGEDFTIGGLSNGFGTVTAGPGQSSVPIRVRLSDDGTSEDDEWVDIYLRAGENYDVGTPSRYTLTITDNDGPGAQFARADSEVGESDGSVGVTVNLVPAPTEDVTINYTVGGGTAQSGDYSIEGLTGSSGSVTVSAGINSVDIPVTINPDSDSEPDETVALTLGNGSDYTVGTTRTHTLTILDDDRPRAEFASAESTVVEADTTHPVQVNLRPAAPTGGLTLSYGVRSTATRNRDYRASGTVQVSEDAESVDIPVEIFHNGESEPDETVELTLRVGSGNNVGEESVHTLTITDNNLPMVAFETAEASVSETGRTHRAVITLDPAPHEDLTIGYTLGATSTAAAGADFEISDLVSGSGTVTARAGRNQVFVPITILNDSDAEGDETLTLTLTGGDGYALDTSANIYELTILDDDAPEVSFTAASGEPGEGAGPHVVRVRLDGQTDNPVTVGVSVSLPSNIGSDNTDDHSAIPGSVTILAGTLETELTVTITDDNLNEADEVVVLTLEPGTGYSLSQDKPTEYTLTIVDNDADENTPVASRDHPHIHGQDSTHFEVYEGHTRIPTWYVTEDFAGDVIFQYVGGTATLDEDFRLFRIQGQIEKVGDTFTVRSLESPHDSDREAGLRWARFTFDPIRDQEREGGETVILRVLNGPGYTVEEPTELTITIID